jgi:serine/threonine protein phosphatase PrpC
MDMTAVCQNCGEPVGEADGFCEGCGTELAPAVDSAGDAGPLECPVCSADASAPPAVIGADGYCESCGRKVPSGRDHVELDIGVAAGVSDRGLRHTRNEDAMAMASVSGPDGPLTLAVVCDGVSSAPRADEASLTAARAAIRVLLSGIRSGADPGEVAAEAASAGAASLTGLAGPSGAPAATYASAIIGGEAVTVCWLGDSRVYWLAADGTDTRCLTTDDSLAEEIVAAGLATAEQAMTLPQAHVITRWLGADLPDPEPHVARFTPPGPGVVLVCSDGLWNYRQDAEGLAALAMPAAATQPLATAAALVKFAVDCGGMDNITVVLAPFPPPGPESSATQNSGPENLPRRTSLMSLPGFTVDVDHNPYLQVGGRDISAVVTVTADASGDTLPQAGAGAGSAEIIAIDCSGSMDSPRTKMIEARSATSAAIDVLGDGVWFAVIQGTSLAREVYPGIGTMAVASDQTRAEAKRAVASLRSSGGTAIGQWLRLARQLFETSPATLRHMILLTDGKNQHETPEQLAEAIALAEGFFSADCRGVGTDWEVSEVRRISSALLGTVDIVPDPAGLAADFEAMMRGALSKQVAGVTLRVWTPQHASVKFVKQVAPAIDDLTARRVQSGPQSGDYPTGAWAPGESRDYHVGIEVTPAGVGQEMLGARISLVATPPSGPEGTTLGQGLVRATWTEDEALSTRISAGVAHYTGQAELAEAIAEGLEATKSGDEDTATARLGRAVQLAHQAGNEDTAKLLSKVVDVVDEATGTVRLKRKVDAADEMALDTRSTKTVRVKKG